MNYNYNFGTLADGVLTFAEVPLIIGGEKFWTNDEALFRQAGYLPIVRTPMPEREGYYYTERYETEGEPQNIFQYWDEHAVEEPETGNLEGRVTNLEETVDTMLLGEVTV